MKYYLPDIISLIDSKPTKMKWKKELKEAINQYWVSNIENNAQEKSSLTLLKPRFIPGTLYIIVQNISCQRENRRASVKIKYLTGTLMLQSLWFTYKQSPSAICLLCHAEDETPSHFLLRCQATEGIQEQFTRELMDLTGCGSHDHKILMRLITGPSDFPIEKKLKLDPGKIEEVSRRMIHSLYNYRSKTVAHLT